MKLKKIAFSIAIALFTSISLSYAAQTTLSNADLSVLIDDSNCKIQVTVADGGRVWTQPTVGGSCSSLNGDGTTATWTYSYSTYWPSSTATLVLSGKTLSFTLSGRGAISGAYARYMTRYPQAFLTTAGDNLVIPNNQGMLVPSNDQLGANYSSTFTVSGVSVYPTRWATYTNNGKTCTATSTGSSNSVYMACNGATTSSGTLTKTSGTGDATITFSAVGNGQSYNVFYQGFTTSLPIAGVTDGDAGYMMIVETAQDAALYFTLSGDYLSPVVNWQPQKDDAGYDRKIKYYFYGSGFDHVTMATLYRAWAATQGFVKTLAEKQSEVSNISKLLGAVEYYNISNAYEDRDSGYATAAGIDNALISPSDYTTNPGAQWSSTTAASVRARGHLTTSYHIYQDSWDPGTAPAAQCYHQGGYTPGTSTYSGYGYVKTKGFTAPSTAAVRTYWKQGYSSSGCGGYGYEVNRKFAYESLQSDTSNRGVKFMVNKMVSEGLLDAVMLDTETANALVEDYDPAHSTTRTDDIYYRQQILQYHKDAGFVVGSESGQWWAVPYVDFLDGMWTLTNTVGWTTNPTDSTNSSTFQTAYTYRIPLWELTNHDNVVSYNRWDDRFEQFSGSSLIEMNKKKLWFMLYGLMPLIRDRNDATVDAGEPNYVTDVLPAVKAVYDVSSLVAGEQMTDHEFLESDYSVQRTTWSNGVTITVDFDTASVTVETPETVQRLIRGNGTVLRNFTFN